MAVGMAVVIIYGSLYPFDFHGRTGSLSALLATWREPPTRANFISNLLLYIPLGYFAVRSLGKSSVLVVVAAGLALCTSVELAQFHDRGRDPGLADIYTNTGGTLLGAIAGVLPVRKPFVVLLIFSWVAGWPRLSAWEFPIQLLAIAVLVGNWFGTNRRRFALVVAVLFTGAVAAQALEPFQFLSTPRSFGLIPFLSFIEGPRENGISVFFEKTFSYGALIWLAVRAGCPFRIATAAGTALVLGLRIAQVYLPGRSAEITDAVMVLMLAAAMKVMEEVP